MVDTKTHLLASAQDRRLSPPFPGGKWREPLLSFRMSMEEATSG